jgi:hypothetical protein
VILTLKILFWWSLLEKREPYRVEFLHKKSLKIVFMRNGSRLQHYLAVKNEIFSSADRAFHINAQIYIPVRFALTLFFNLFVLR